MDCLGRLEAGTEVVAFGRGAVLGFLLRGGFAGEDFTAGLVVVFGGASSSEDSENTGVPCLKVLSSESELENPSVEEEISSIIGTKGLEVLGVDLKIILADLRGG